MNAEPGAPGLPSECDSVPPHSSANSFPRIKGSGCTHITLLPWGTLAKRCGLTPASAKTYVG
jgi:hypothetical protein